MAPWPPQCLIYSSVFNLVFGRSVWWQQVINSGKEKRRFSMPLFTTCCHQIDLPKTKLNTELYIFCCIGRQKCIKLQICTYSFKNFMGWHPRPPKLGRGQLSPVTRPSHQRASIIPLFQSFCGRCNDTFTFTFYLLKNEIKETSWVWRMSRTTRQRAALLAAPEKIDDTPEQKQIYNCNKSIYLSPFKTWKNQLLWW